MTAEPIPGFGPDAIQVKRALEIVFPGRAVRIRIHKRLGRAGKLAPYASELA